MARIAFRDITMRGKRAALVQVCNEIIDDYQSQGYRLTLRQLYYQLVSRDLVPKLQRGPAGVPGLWRRAHGRRATMHLPGVS